jgi:hypothetical protein
MYWQSHLISKKCKVAYERNYKKYEKLTKLECMLILQEVLTVLFIIFPSYHTHSNISFIVLTIRARYQ